MKTAAEPAAASTELVSVIDATPLAHGPIQFTPEKRKAFLDAIAAGKSLTTAADAASTSTVTIRRWLRRSSTFRAAFEQAGDAAVDFLEDVLDRKARAGEIAAVIFSLKGRRPDKWRDGPQVQINQQINIAGEIDAARDRAKRLRK